MGTGREIIVHYFPLKLHACAVHKIIVKCNVDGIMQRNVRRN